MKRSKKERDNYKRQMEFLENQLQHKDFRVRYKAIDDLGKIGSERAIHLLIKAIGMSLETDHDSKINLHASGALLKIGQPALPFMLEAFEGKKETTYLGRYWIARSFGAIQAPLVFDTLVNVLKKENGSIAHGIAESLARHGDIRAEPHLRAKLKKENITADTAKAIADAIDKLLGQTISTTFNKYQDEKNAIEAQKHTPTNSIKESKRKPVNTDVGFLAGRDAIYLDKLEFKNGNLILRGSFNGHLASEVNEEGMIDFQLVFIGTLAFTSIELDSWDFYCASSFDETLNSEWCVNLGGKVTTNHKHYSIQTYDDVIDVVCHRFELVIEKK